MDGTADAWQAHFKDLFPAYLLPRAKHEAIERPIAERLVQRVLGSGTSFGTFRASTLLTSHGDEIREFAMRALPDLCQSLQGRTEVVPESRRGHLIGRLDVVRTLAARLRGDRETLVSRVRARRYNHPSEVALRAVAVRLLDVLTSLQQTWAGAAPKWADAADGCARTLRSTLERTSLHRVESMPFDDVDPEDLRIRSHRAFVLATVLYDALRDTLDSDDPRRIARCVARGALWPMEDWQRFELVVALSLARLVEQRLADDVAGAWEIQHTVIDAQREELVAFRDQSGRTLRMFYNQSRLTSSFRQDALTHYFGEEASTRPDVVVIGEVPGRIARAVVVEVKLSENLSYLRHGFDEAIGYAIDYAPWLAGPASSALVVPRALRAAPRAGDRVVAIGWADWLRPNAVLDAVIATVLLD